MKNSLQQAPWKEVQLGTLTDANSFSQIVNICLEGNLAWLVRAQMGRCPRRVADS